MALGGDRAGTIDWIARMTPYYEQDGIKHGDRVQTPDGPGGVVYVRMKPPDYTDALVVSVLLDAHKHRIDYRGTVFMANRVVKL